MLVNSCQQSSSSSSSCSTIILTSCVFVRHALFSSPPLEVSSLAAAPLFLPQTRRPDREDSGSGGRGGGVEEGAERSARQQARGKDAGGGKKKEMECFPKCFFKVSWT